MPSRTDIFISTEKKLPRLPIVDFEITGEPLELRFYDSKGKRIVPFLILPKEIEWRLAELREAGYEAKIQTKPIILEIEILKYMEDENLRVLKKLDEMLSIEIQERYPNQIFIRKLEESIAEFKEWCALNNVEYSDTDPYPEPNRPENEDMATGESVNQVRTVIETEATAGLRKRLILLAKYQLKDGWAKVFDFHVKEFSNTIENQSSFKTYFMASKAGRKIEPFLETGTKGYWRFKSGVDINEIASL
ncbi:MAG: hypothetical protein K9N22_05320 [Candidatus Marinimicrobia bacterium]|nr:hypothetical protein [Candidatus Neomarinimicrobiota bacterium]